VSAATSHRTRTAEQKAMMAGARNTWVVAMSGAFRSALLARPMPTARPGARRPSSVAATAGVRMGMRAGRKALHP